MHHGTVLAQLREHFLVGFGVIAQKTLPAGLRGIVDGRVHLLVKTTIETAHHILPVGFPLCNVIEFLLHIGRKAVVHNLFEIILQVVVHNDTHIRRDKFVLLISVLFLFHLFFDAVRRHGEAEILTFLALAGGFTHIFAFLDGGNSGSIG